MIDGNTLLTKALDELRIDLSRLVARCSIWVHPEVFHRLNSFRPNAVWFPDCRRVRVGEKVKSKVDGVCLDDNSKANLAIKNAVFAGSKHDCKGMHACHVWPKSCYNVRYHTSLANIVLLPAALAGFSDYDDDIAEMLKSRSFQLFGWVPENEARPVRPASYPDELEWAPLRPVEKPVLQRIDRLRRNDDN